MNNIAPNKYFRLFYFISYLSFAFVMTNYTPFLSGLGYDEMQRGILLSSYAITTILFQVIFGVISDIKQSVKRIIIISIGLYTLTACLLYNQTEKLLGLHILLIALSGGLLNANCGMFDTWVINISEEYKKSLSFIKAFGSIGWALGSVGASYIISIISYKGMALALLALSVLMFFNMKILPDIDKVEKKKKVSLGEILKIFSNKKYTLLVFILLLMYSVVVANNCTVVDKLIKLGASRGEISLKWFTQSLVEIPTYIMGGIILKRFNSYNILKISCLAITIQFILFSICNNVRDMIILNIFQLFSTPLILISSKKIIDEISDKNIKGSSQLIAMSIFTGLSSMIVPAIAGTLTMKVGIDLTLLLEGLLGVIAFALIYVLQFSTNFLDPWGPKNWKF